MVLWLPHRIFGPRLHVHAQASKIQAKLDNMTTATPSTQTTRVKTRFLVISDTHSASPGQITKKPNVVPSPSLPKADVLLHCGDLTMIGHLDEYETTLKMLGTIEADLKLVIAGNHDITLDEAYYHRKGQFMHSSSGFSEDLPMKAREMWLGERAKAAGVTYLEEGTHSFTLKNGAKLRVGPTDIWPEYQLTAEGIRVSIPA
jgi:predicted MPP superfamily phosphohydrolase